MSYTPASPRGNEPVIAGDQDTLPVHERDAFGHASAYLTQVAVAAFLSGMFTVVFVVAGTVLSEGASWILSVAKFSSKLRPGTATVLLSPFFVKMMFSIALPERTKHLSGLSRWVVAIIVSFSFVVLVFFLRGFEPFILEYNILLGGALFIVCYAEMLAVIRQGQQSPG